MSRSRLSALLLTLPLFLSLSACGGGGGDSSPPELSLGALTPGAITATMADRDAGPRPQVTLSASYTGTASGTVYVVVDDPDRLITYAMPAFSDGRATLTLDLSTSAAPGRYTQPVVIKACKDAACTRQYAGSPQTVSKDVRVESIVVSATTMSFSAPIGAGAPAQNLTVTPPVGKDYAYAPLYVDYRSPTGSRSALVPSEVFDITRTATGLQIKPKGGWAGSYSWPLVLQSPGYADKQVTINYEVTGNGVQPLTLLTSTLAVSAGSSNQVFADVDALVNMPYSEIRFTITGSPDPVQTGWLLYYTSENFTSGSGPANNARHMRFKFDRCGYGSFYGCLGGGTYNATVRMDVMAFGETWTYTVPVTFTVP